MYCISHFVSILVTKQALHQSSVESFSYRLIPMNVNAPTANGCFMVFHRFCHSTHEFPARINLQQLTVVATLNQRDHVCKSSQMLLPLPPTLLMSELPLLCNGLATSTTVKAYLYIFCPRPHPRVSWGKKRRSAWCTALGEKTSNFGLGM